MKISSYKDIDKAIEQSASMFQGYYLDYLNDFLTIEGYARYYSISLELAQQRIRIGRVIHRQRTERAA